MANAPRRLMVFGLAVFASAMLLATGLSGLFGPAQSLISAPVSAAQEGASSLSRQIGEFLGTLADFQNLQRYNAELERALVNLQAEIVELREIRADYQRLAALQNFQGVEAVRRFLTASVIGRDTTGLVRTIRINRGSRDGLAVGMPVVTELGLVGRISRVEAISATVQLAIDVNSFVNARMQTSRSEGSIRGTEAGGLQMLFIPLNDAVSDGDSVVTSGIGGNFPRGLLIGQVTSSRLSDNKLFQEATVRSLVDFTRLEVVRVITDFERVEAAAPPAPGQ